MSVKRQLEWLVRLQAREQEMQRLEQAMVELEEEREERAEEIRRAEAAVESAEESLEECQKEIRRLDMELKTAEEKVSKYRDQLLEVKTNKELWALQEEIETAEEEVGDVEEQSLVQMERADELEETIGERQEELRETRQRVEAAREDIDRREAEVRARQQEVEAALSGLRDELSDDLLERYEAVKRIRDGRGLAEARDGVCHACNFTLRPQLWVELRNLEDILACENCKRLLWVREVLDLPAGLLGPEAPEEAPDPSGAAAGASEPIPTDDARQ